MFFLVSQLGVEGYTSLLEKYEVTIHEGQEMLALMI